MKKKIILSLTLFSLVLILPAQTAVFKIISSKGQTEIKRGNKWIPVSRGGKVYEGSRLRIKENGYLGLVHKSGKPVSLKKQGEYDVNTLASKINVRSAGFASKYGNYIANKMTSSSSSMVSARISGSVTRDLFDNEDLSVLVGEDSKIRLSPTLIKWDTKEAGPYKVTFMNLFEEVIYETTTDKKEVEVNLAGKNVQGNICLLKVLPINNPNAKVTHRKFDVITGSTATKINTDLTEIERELDLNNALDNYFFATYFEDKKLNLEALHYYEKAMKMEPDVEDYKSAYNNFLIKNGLKNMN